MKSSFSPHSAALDWWMPNQITADGDEARPATRTSRAGPARATRWTLMTAHAAVKRARPSFHDATEPVDAERQAQAVEGDEGDGQQDAPLRAQRRSTRPAAMPTTATSTSGSRPVTVAPTTTSGDERA